MALAQRRERAAFASRETTRFLNRVRFVPRRAQVGPLLILHANQPALRLRLRLRLLTLGWLEGGRERKRMVGTVVVHVDQLARLLTRRAAAADDARLRGRGEEAPAAAEHRVQQLLHRERLHRDAGRLCAGRRLDWRLGRATGLSQQRGHQRRQWREGAQLLRPASGLLSRGLGLEAAGRELRLLCAGQLVVRVKGGVEGGERGWVGGESRRTGAVGWWPLADWLRLSAELASNGGARAGRVRLLVELAVGERLAAHAGTHRAAAASGGRFGPVGDPFRRRS